MGEKKHYWFCVLSDSNTEDRKTHKELGVGSGAAPSLVCEPARGRRGREETKRGRRWGATPDNTNASLPRVVCSVPSLPSFLPSSSVLNGRVNKARHCTAGDEPPSLSPPRRIAFPPPPIRPVTPEPWQHSPVDLLFHETPSCSLLGCNQISLLGKHAGSRQEEEHCLCGLSPLSSSCVSPAEVRWERSTFLVLMWPRLTKKELSVTAADKSCH